MFGNPVSRNIAGPVTFPCANTTDVAPNANFYVSNFWYAAAAPTGEFTGIVDDVLNGQQGTPIAVFANPGESLVLTNASVTMRGGAGVPITLVSADRNLYGYEGYVWPKQNLLPNTTYDVLIFGTINGVAFRKEFPFKTGAAIPFNLP
jgi:hypothetical protein